MHKTESTAPTQDSLKLLRPIVVEGPDGSGKSTFVSTYFPGAKHMGGPVVSYEQLMDRCYSIRSGEVYDRWSGISERIYGPIVRGVTLTSMDHLDQIALELSPLVIYCRPPLAVIAENVKSKQLIKEHKPEHFIREIQAKNREVVHAYDELLLERLPKLGIAVMQYDYTSHLS